MEKRRASYDSGGMSSPPTERQRNSISSSIKKGLNFFRLRGGSLSSSTAHQSSFSGSSGIAGAMTKAPARKKASKGTESPGTPGSINKYVVPYMSKSITTVVVSDRELCYLLLRTIGSLLCQKIV